MLIDTHCHIHDRDTYNFAISRQQAQGNEQTAADFIPEKIIDRAHAADVEKMVCVGCTHEDSLLARDFAAAHDNVFWSYGIHPEECDRKTDACFFVGGAEPADVPHEKNVPGRPIAIGEVGLDYHSEGYNREKQIKLLEQMLELATKNDLPLIFHVRTSAAFADFWPIVDNMHIKNAVVHSFSDTSKNLELTLDHDFYVGVNGMATFMNLYPSGLPPLERILLETDAPFLTPVPFHSQVNEPAHIKDIATWLARKTNKTIDEIATQTTKNAEKLFSI